MKKHFSQFYAIEEKPFSRIFYFEWKCLFYAVLKWATLENFGAFQGDNIDPKVVQKCPKTDHDMCAY